ncbi:MAG: hypothetical protein PVI44_13085 [Balneolaceae bacterium]
MNYKSVNDRIRYMLKKVTGFIGLCLYPAVLSLLSLFCGQLALAQGKTVVPDTSANRDFHYGKAPCPFDTTGMDTKNLECSYLTVPENRKKNNDKTIRLAVTILKAGKKVKPALPVLLLEDGPGVSAPLGAMVGTHKFMPDRDLIVLDMRGTGFSKPVLCPWLNSTYGGETGLPGGYVEALDLSPKEASEHRWKRYSSKWHDLSLIGFNSDGCRVWKTGSMLPPQLDPVKSDIPVLAETGTLDPTLMPHIIDSTLTGFSKVQQVRFPTGTHNPGSRTVNCMLGLMKSFFQNPVDSLDISCVAKMPPMKFKMPDK